MASVAHYESMIGEALGGTATKRGAELSWSYDNKPEAQAAVKDIRLKQKELRHIKKLLNEEIKSIRQGYAGRIAGVGSGSGLTGLLIGKGRASSLKADRKRQLSRERDKAISPYNDIKLNIDRILLQLDGAKMKIEQAIQADIY